MSNEHTAEEIAEAAWIKYRNGIQMRAPWESRRRAMRRLRKRDFIAGYLVATRDANLKETS